MIQQFWAGSMVRQAAILVSGTAFGQLVGLLVAPVLTRIYSPDEFGILAIYIAALGMISIGAGLRYELAIPLPDTKREAVTVLALSLSCVVAVSALTSLAIWIFGESILRVMDSSELAPYLWLLPVGVLAVGSYQSFSFWVVRTGHFSILARTKAAQGVTAAAIQLILGLLQFGPIGLLLGHLSAQAAGLFALTRDFRTGSLSLRVPAKQLAQTAKRYIRFAMLGTPAAFLDTAGLQLPSILLAGVYGPEAAGLFLLSQRVLGAPVNLIARSVGQVYLSEASGIVRTTSSGMRALIIATVRRLGAIIIIPLAILVIFGPGLFRLVFGDDWTEAGVYTQLLCLMLLGQFTASPVAQTLTILERQDAALYLNLAKALIAAATILVAPLLDLTSSQAILFYSAGMFVFYCCYLIIVLALADAYDKKAALT